MRPPLLGVIVGIVVTAAVVVSISARVATPFGESLGPSLPAHGADGGDAFPWDGGLTLVDDSGERLTWTVERVGGEVHLVGVHPSWRVEHHARPDGTPLLTVKQSRGMTTRVTWLSEGVRLVRTDASGKVSSVSIPESGLWDESTVVARLAGVRWAPGTQLRVRILDLEIADGRVYPMIAEYLGEERSGGEPCHRVRLGLDDFRRLVAPTFEFCFASGPGARLLRYEGEGFTFH